jgi:8-oxo-dGTP diphosphatase
MAQNLREPRRKNDAWGTHKAPDGGTRWLCYRPVVIRVVAAVIEHRGRLLICQRRNDDVFALRWEFPGGKIRRSETPRAALARELREELGVRVQIGAQIHRTLHRYKNLGDRLELTFFKATEPSGPPRNIVFNRIAWVRRTELRRYDFLPADRALVAGLIRGDFSAS